MSLKNSSIQSWDKSDPRAVRHACREFGYTGYTAGLAPGYVQANICILPKAWAEDFLLFCQRNPKPCPLIARSDVGDPRLPTLAKDLDIRTDVPRYHVFCDGKFVEEVTDITRYWQDDLVTFALGCSFSFEEALQDAGIPLPFLEKDSVAGVYVSSLPTELAGPYKAPLVVTMRGSNQRTPFAQFRSPRAFQMCTARQSTSVIPRKSVSTFPIVTKTSETARSGTARSRCFGPAVSLPNSP